MEASLKGLQTIVPEKNWRSIARLLSPDELALLLTDTQMLPVVFRSAAEDHSVSQQEKECQGCHAPRSCCIESFNTKVATWETFLLV